MTETPNSRPGAGGAAPRSHAPLHLLNGALFVALWLFTGLAYGALPDQVPAHLGLSGVTRWTSRESGIWFLLPVLGTFHAFLMYALSGVGEGGAAGINVPQKERLLALPKEGQRYALAPTRPFMYGMAAWLLALTFLVQLQLFDAARAGPGGEADPWLPVVLVFAALPLPAVWWLSRRIRRRIDAWERAAGSAGGPSP